MTSKSPTPTIFIILLFILLPSIISSTYIISYDKPSNSHPYFEYLKDSMTVIPAIRFSDTTTTMVTIKFAIRYINSLTTNSQQDLEQSNLFTPKVFIQVGQNVNDEGTMIDQDAIGSPLTIGFEAGATTLLIDGPINMDTSSPDKLIAIYFIINQPVLAVTELYVHTNNDLPLKWQSYGLPAYRDSLISLYATPMDELGIKITIPPITQALRGAFELTSTPVMMFNIDIFDYLGDLAGTQIIPQQMYTIYTSAFGTEAGTFSGTSTSAFQGIAISMDYFNDEELYFFLQTDSPLPSDKIFHLHMQFTTKAQEISNTLFRHINKNIIPITPTNDQPFQIINITPIDTNQFSVEIQLERLYTAKYRLQPTHQFQTIAGVNIVSACTSSELSVSIITQPVIGDIQQLIEIDVLQDGAVTNIKCDISYNYYILHPPYENLFSTLYHEVLGITWSLTMIGPNQQFALPNIIVPIIPNRYSPSIEELIRGEGTRPNYYSKSISHGPTQIVPFPYTVETLSIHFVGFQRNTVLYFSTASHIGIEGMPSPSASTPKTIISENSIEFTLSCRSSTNTQLCKLIPNIDDYIHQDSLQIQIFRRINIDSNDIYFQPFSPSLPTSSVSNINDINLFIDIPHVGLTSTSISEPKYYQQCHEYLETTFQSYYRPVPLLEISNNMTVVSSHDDTFPINLAPSKRLHINQVNNINSIWLNSSFYKQKGIELQSSAEFEILFNSPIANALSFAPTVTHFQTSSIPAGYQFIRKSSYIPTSPTSSYQSFPGFYPLTLLKLDQTLLLPGQQWPIYCPVKGTFIDGNNVQHYQTLHTAFYLSNGGTSHTFFQFNTTTYQIVNNNLDINSTTNIQHLPLITTTTMNNYNEPSTYYLQQGIRFTTQFITNLQLSTNLIPIIELYYYQPINSTHFDSQPTLLKRYQYQTPSSSSSTTTPTLLYNNINEFTLPTNIKIERGYFTFTYQTYQTSILSLQLQSQPITITTRTTNFFSLPQQCYGLKSNILSTHHELINQRQSWENKCRNGGICLSNGTCQCPIGYNGEYCTNIIDQNIIDNPLLIECPQCNTANTLQCPPSTSTSTSEQQQQQCQCKNDWIGLTCNEPKSCTIETSKLCISNENGFVNQTSTSTTTTSPCGTKCTCYNNWIGDKCNQCNIQCYNNGIIWSRCDKCGCPSGYSGQYCECLASGTNNNGVILNGYNGILQLLSKINYYRNNGDNNNNNFLQQYNDEFIIDLEQEYNIILNEIKNDFSSKLGLQSNSIQLQITSTFQLDNGDEQQQQQQQNNTIFKLSIQYGCDNYNPTITKDELSLLWKNNIINFIHWDSIQNYFIFPLNEQPTIITNDELTDIPESLPPPEQRLQINYTIQEYNINIFITTIIILILLSF